jgi:hypothetical protein
MQRFETRATRRASKAFFRPGKTVVRPAGEWRGSYFDTHLGWCVPFGVSAGVFKKVEVQVVSWSTRFRKYIAGLLYP